MIATVSARYHTNDDDLPHYPRLMRREERCSLDQLGRFRPETSFSFDAQTVRSALHSKLITSVVSCPLGPDGTNMALASDLWLHEMGITQKSRTVHCSTPEVSVERARQATFDSQIGIFWSCAVYIREHELFYRNLDTLPFFSQHTMNLDEMQLAAKPCVVDEIDGNSIPSSWRILTHPSPKPLVERIGCGTIECKSNSEAARRCRAGDAELCVTTKSAMESNSLVKVHSFGSPSMVFFAGITEEAVVLLERAANSSDAMEDRR